MAEVVDSLGVERVDHGVHTLDDPELLRRLEQRHMPLTVCPLSNLKVRVTCRVPALSCLLALSASLPGVPHLRMGSAQLLSQLFVITKSCAVQLKVYDGELQQRMGELLRSKLCITINSDDPGAHGLQLSCPCAAQGSSVHARC